MDKLKASSSARIINNTALAFKLGEINFEDLNHDNKDYKPGEMYAQSKLAMMLFTKQLAKELEGKLTKKMYNSFILIQSSHKKSYWDSHLYMVILWYLK